jgi:hypothetical protein
MPALDFPRVTDFNSFDVTKGRELTGICNCAIVVMVYSGSGTYGALGVGRVARLFSSRRIE